MTDDGPEGGGLLAWVEEWAWHAVVVLFYLPVANGAVAYLWWTEGEYFLYTHTVGTNPARDALLGVAVGLALFTAGAVLTPRIGLLQRMAQALGQAIGRPSWTACAVLAASSALGEELLFRGVIQERLGLAVAVLAFASAHVPWERAMFPWPIFALGSGVLLGLLYDQTGAVLAPVVAHAVTNLLSLKWIGTRYGTDHARTTETP